MTAVICPKCFYRIVDITKPCAHCGCSVEEINAAIKRREEESAKAEEEKNNKEEAAKARIAQLIQEGKAMRCPSCNTILNNVYKNCLSCGFSKKSLLERANNQHLIISPDGTLIGRKTEDEIRKEEEAKEQHFIDEGKAIRCPSCNALVKNVNNPCPQCGCTDGLLQIAQINNLIIRYDGTIDGWKTKEMLLDEDKAIECPGCGTILTNVLNECPFCGLSSDLLRKEADEKQLDYTNEGVITGIKEEVRLQREEQERKKQEELRKEEERRIEEERKRQEEAQQEIKKNQEALERLRNDTAVDRMILYSSNPSIKGNGIIMKTKIWIIIQGGAAIGGGKNYIPVSAISYVTFDDLQKGIMRVFLNRDGTTKKNSYDLCCFVVGFPREDAEKVRELAELCLSLR